MTMVGTHDWALVVMSLVIAVFASFTALSLAGRIRAARDWTRRIWIGAAAVALGGGIWSMHFVAMLAFAIPGVAMSYDLTLTLASLLIAVAFTGLGFAVMKWDELSPTRTGIAGLLMGIGVLAMHYLGMAAIRMHAAISYGRMWVAISVLIAIGAATAAVWLASRDRRLVPTLLAALVMGAAIAGMHYAGMQAASFTHAEVANAPDTEAGIGQAYLGFFLTGLTSLILLMALGAARLERWLHGIERREARNALRLHIADVLRGRDTEAALQEVAALMGRHFGVSRTGYGLLDPLEDVFDYDVCWTDGSVVPLIGRFPAAAFGVKIVAALNAGKTVAVNDLLHDELSDEIRTRETARDVDTRAILVVPFVRDGRLRTIVYLNDRQPHQWHANDIAFMEEIAERTRLVIERAAVEEQLRELNATLEARVEERTRELRETQDALLQSQKMEAVGQLVAGLAHDFNNVLGAIVGAFDLIRRRSNEPARVDELAQSGIQGAERGAKLTGQLLTFSRVQPFQLQSMLVCDVLEALRELLVRALGPMIRLEFKLNPSPRAVQADPTQVEMMVLNLAINARDAMPDGGTLEISTSVRSVGDDPELDAGEYVEIAVRDSGVGMDEETLRRAMEPFFTTKEVGKGTGLGLAQVYGSARQLGGTVQMESTLGRGTTVRILLPVTDAIAASAAPDDTPSAGESHRALSVLFVDDDVGLRTLFAGALRDQGHNVREAADGDEALAVLDGFSPDIMIVDFAMPGMTGAELVKRVVQSGAGIPVLFISGFADVAAIEAVTAGEARILRKPFRIDDLKRAVEDMLPNSPVPLLAE